MLNRRMRPFIRFVALILIFTMTIPVFASAVSDAVQPRASYYLNNYGAYIFLPGDGEVRVYFDVTGTGYMDELGALSIQIYECSTNSSNINDWTWKKTFTHDSTPGMLSYNDNFHGSYVTYQGTEGKYYKAYVCIWGGKDGDGDTRYFWTSAKR